MRYRSITSPNNPLVKAFRKAAGGEAHEFAVLEGPKLIGEALEFGIELRHVAAAESYVGIYAELLSRCFESGANTSVLGDRLLSSVSDVKTGQGIAALAIPRFPSLEEVKWEGAPLIAVADGIQDPGNVGAVARSAAAFGADALVLLPGSANPFAPKAMRGSAGACLRIPICRADASRLLKWLRKKGIAAVGLDHRGESDLREFDFKKPCAIIVGNEGGGLSAAVRAGSDALVRIPISAAVESLNAAVAASIALFEVWRQRAEEQP
jgi:TrmH family RNA methyltransferase